MISILEEYKVSFEQNGLNKSGTGFEIQYFPLRALDGINGRFYQLVLMDMVGEERFWSFTEPEHLVSVIMEFIEAINKKEEALFVRLSLLQKGLNKIGEEDEQQFLPLMANEGIDGRYYQIVINNDRNNEMGWSFKDPIELLPMIKKFIEWANKIDDM